MPRQESRSRRAVVVVGGGVFGVTSAIELSRRGWSVTLIDPGPIPHPDAASTDLSKIVRMDYGADELYTALAEEALAGWDRWNREWPRPLYHEDGFLLMRQDAMVPGGFEHDSFRAVAARGHAPERMESALLAARFPAWNAERYADGYLSRRAGWAESGAVVAQLVAIARDAGVLVREELRFADFAEQGGRLAGVLVEGTGPAGRREMMAADTAVMAVGAWTPFLVPELSDVMWAVGQPVFHFRPTDAATFRAPVFPPWAADISRTGWYGFPANADGIVKVANHGEGVRVNPSDPRRVAPDEDERFRAFLRDTFPGLAGAPIVGRRLCLYCDTWDGDFWIDHHAACAGVVIAAGDSGHAFKFAPLLGALIAGVVEGKPDPRAARFARRARGALVKEAARHVDARGSG